MRNYFENDFTSFSFQDGILYIVYHLDVIIVYHLDVIINLSAAVQIVNDRLTLQEGQSYPVLCDITGIKEINKAARAYLAMEGSILLSAVAVLVKPPVSQMMSEFYIKTSNPPIPTKTFDNKEDALEFLKNYLQ